ncbi:MAG TPA: iron-sulfur cluster assembly scaffold protein [Gammaproteobacteria bacterium]|nr:iron-sulfur cluster assembly scaffold protein [Gammaproteobacteria bacterium]
MDYSPEVVQRFAAAGAEGQGERLPSAEAGRVAAGEAEDRTLNVWVRFEVEVSQGIVRRASFQVFGCPHTVAAASWVADSVRGKPAEALARLDVQQLRRALGVPTEKLGKLLRIEDAVSACWDGLRDQGKIRKAADGGFVD